MKRILLFIISFFFLMNSSFCQEIANSGIRILFHGKVIDSKTFFPIANSQIMINRSFSSVSSADGTFAFYVNRYDTVLFRHLGYKSTLLFVSDTLNGEEFIAGIYMNSDTLSIGEVVIVPRLRNLKSEILNARSKSSTPMENARYNVALSAYQGRTTLGKLGDPSANYESLRQKQKIDAYERGGIPSDKMVGISPLLLLPAAYLLLHGSPKKPAPFEQDLSDQELDQIQKKYVETLNQRK
jgi:hypothetical protein